MLESFHAPAEQLAALTTPEFVAALGRGAWPGNVRELRNHIERCLAMQDSIPVDQAADDASPAAGGAIDPTLPYADARARALAHFERVYAGALVRLHGDNVSAASRAAGIARIYLHRLLRRHGLR
jgi:DNA-binding NtrC family response regulator